MNRPFYSGSSIILCPFSSLHSACQRVAESEFEHGGSGVQTGDCRHLQHGGAHQGPGLATSLLLPRLVRHHARYSGVPPHGQSWPHRHRLSQQVSEVRGRLMIFTSYWHVMTISEPGTGSSLVASARRWFPSQFHNFSMATVSLSENWKADAISVLTTSSVNPQNMTPMKNSVAL